MGVFVFPKRCTARVSQLQTGHQFKHVTIEDTGVSLFDRNSLLQHTPLQYFCRVLASTKGALYSQLPAHIQYAEAEQIHLGVYDPHHVQLLYLDYLGTSFSFGHLEKASLPILVDSPHMITLSKLSHPSKA